ncbi:MAG: ElyC/SanA/YdcF family protein [Candidatus Sulfotelmatobacter sp.]
MKTSPKKITWTVIFILFLGLILFALNAGNILVIDDPKPSDVIVVLAGETDRRPARALELLYQGLAPRVLIDVPAQAKLYDTMQVELAERYVRNQPHSAAIAICPIEGLSTLEESHDVERCLAHERGERVLIVTSDFHTRRSLSIFRHELHDKSFSIAAAHDNAQFGTHWWTHRQWAKTCMDEWMRLIWWEAVERWK